MTAQMTHFMRRTHHALTHGYTGAANDTIDDRSVYIDVLVTWDHDWHRHVLTQQQLLRTDDATWNYALWHVKNENEFTLLRWFGPTDHDRVPLIESAIIVDGRVGHCECT